MVHSFVNRSTSKIKVVEQVLKKRLKPISMIYNEHHLAMFTSSCDYYYVLS